MRRFEDADNNETFNAVWNIVHMLERSLNFHTIFTEITCLNSLKATIRIIRILVALIDPSKTKKKEKGLRKDVENDIGRPCR